MKLCTIKHFFLHSWQQLIVTEGMRKRGVTNWRVCLNCKMEQIKKDWLGRGWHENGWREKLEDYRMDGPVCKGGVNEKPTRPQWPPVQNLVEAGSVPPNILPTTPPPATEPKGQGGTDFGPVASTVALCVLLESVDAEAFKRAMLLHAKYCISQSQYVLIENACDAAVREEVAKAEKERRPTGPNGEVGLDYVDYLLKEIKKIVDSKPLPPPPRMIRDGEHEPESMVVCPTPCEDKKYGDVPCPHKEPHKQIRECSLRNSACPQCHLVGLDYEQLWKSMKNMYLDYTIRTGDPAIPTFGALMDLFEKNTAPVSSIEATGDEQEDEEGEVENV